MSSFNVISSGRPQVLVDEHQLQQLQSEASRRGEELKRLQAAMETLSAVNLPVHFVAAAMALCNELASRWSAERVGIGFLRGRYVRLKALSHTEKITRHMQLVQDIEAAMEECLDQDVEVMFPPGKDATYVYRAAETLATRHGPNAVINFPMRRAHPSKRADERFGNVVAVLSIERKSDRPFTLSEVETLRLTSDLFTARLVDLYENDRWFGAKLLRATRRGLSWLVGAKHTWAKIAAVAISGFLAFAFLKNGTFRVDAPFEFQASEQQVLAAPFDGFLKTVKADIGDMVFTERSGAPFDDLNQVSPLGLVLRVPRPPTVMASLETAEIRTKLASSMAEREVYLLQARNLAAEPGKEGERQVALSQADRSDAEVRLYQWQIDQASIKAPIDGLVFSGDLTTKLGAPVHTGDELFKIGQLEQLRAEMSVPEDQISELKIGQHGQIKASSYPNRPINVTVERITPIAGVTGTANVFKVRVALDPKDLKLWMRPGMMGNAKIDISQARYAWIWTHRMINWVRMKLWI